MLVIKGVKDDMTRTVEDVDYRIIVPAEYVEIGSVSCSLVHRLALFQAKVCQ